MTPTAANILINAWPIRMNAELSATYVGEETEAKFLAGVKRGEYPKPCIDDGRGRSRRQLWLKKDLDASITSDHDEFEVG